MNIKDLSFKTSGNFQYAEVLVNGKAGSRQIPLISSIPYVKDWLDEHPQMGNPNAPLICGFGKSLGRRIKPLTLNRIYDNYKNGLFPKLLFDPSVLSEDKQKIRVIKETMEPIYQAPFCANRKINYAKGACIAAARRLVW